MLSLRFRDKFFGIGLFSATILFLLFVPMPGRAGEGVKKSCFTLMNPEKIPADATVEQRLAMARLDVHIEHKTLEKVLADFEETVGVPVVVLPDVRRECDNWDTSDRLLRLTIRGMSARGYLDYLCRMLSSDEIDWTVRKEKIVIEKLEDGYGSMITKVYKVDLLFDSHKDTGEWNYFSDRLMDLVTYLVQPEDWDCVGGPGSIEAIELSGAKVLVVRNSYQVQKQVAGLLAGLERMLTAKEPDGYYSIDEEAQTLYRKAMEQKVTLDCKKMPLSEVVATIRQQTGIPMMVDPAGLAEEGIRMDHPITYRCKNRSLRVVQKDIFDRISLTWASRFSVILLTSQVVRDGWENQAIFDVTDLAKGPGEDDFDMDSLSEFILQSVDPDTWCEVGGPGAIKSFTSKGRAFLLLSQSGATIERIHQALAGLRAIKAGTTNCYPQPTDANRQLARKMARKADWNIEKKILLTDFLADVKRRYGIESMIDIPILEEFEHGLDSFKIGPLQLKACSLEEVLTVLLDPYQSGWSIRDGRIFISTKEWLGYECSLKIYEVSDLTVGVDKQGKKVYDLDSLIDLITATADPESWEVRSGPGCISDFSFCGRNVLAIRHTDRGHKEIAKLLADLRAAMPKDPAKRILPVRVPRESKKQVPLMFGDGLAAP